MQTDLVDLQVSGFRSRFGGFWTDHLQAEQMLADKVARGDFARALVEKFRFWMDHGYVVFERAIAADVVDRVNADVERAWQGGFRHLYCAYGQDGVSYCQPPQPFMRELRTKLLDLYSQSDAAREASLSHPLVEFLSALFERPPLLFQSLYFQRGSQQRMHQDAAFVKVSSPMKFVGVWVALEDIQEGSGELEYYDGSHRIEEHLWDGKYKSMPWQYYQQPEHLRYLESLHEKSNALGFPRITYRPRKGDVLVWHADLVHGGCEQRNEQLTRRSFALHFSANDLVPYYFGHSGGAGPYSHPSGAYYAYEYHEVMPPTLADRVRRKMRKLRRRIRETLATKD